MMRCVSCRTLWKRAIASQAGLKSLQDLSDPSVVQSIQELVRDEGHKTWLVPSHLTDEIVSSADGEFMWCPRSNDLVFVNSSVTSFSDPIHNRCTISKRGLVASRMWYKREMLHVKNPLTRHSTTISMPKEDDHEIKNLIYSHTDLSVADAGLFVVDKWPRPDRGSSLRVYSSLSKQWEVRKTSLFENEDKEHSLAEFLGVWFRGFGNFNLYNPVFNSWKSIPPPENEKKLSRYYRLHVFEGRLYVLLQESRDLWLEVWVYSEELKSWKRIGDRMRHKPTECNDSGVLLESDGPYMFAYMVTERNEASFLVVFDLESHCWLHHVEIPFESSVTAYTPTIHKNLFASEQEIV